MNTLEIEDAVLEKVDNKSFVTDMQLAKQNGFDIQVTISAKSPHGEQFTMSYEPKQFTFNRVVEKSVNENVELWRFIHASLSKDDVDAVYELNSFYDSLHSSVKKARVEKNAKIAALLKKNTATKLKTKLNELVDDDEDVATGSGSTGGLANAGIAAVSGVANALGLGATNKRQRAD